MNEKNFFLLLEIAKKTKLNDQLTISTIQLANDLQISQQSISRKLRELEQTGLITRKVSPTGSQISITPKGKQMLQKKFVEIETIFKQNQTQNIEGTILSGLGEGKYYTSLEEYKKQFKEKLGYNIYPGTLNIKIEELDLQRFLKEQKEITIKGFKTKQRSFGDIICYQIKINNEIDGAIIIPQRSNHPKNVIELISPVYLRKKYALEDGDKIKTHKQ